MYTVVGGRGFILSSFRISAIGLVTISVILATTLLEVLRYCILWPSRPPLFDESVNLVIFLSHLIG